MHLRGANSGIIAFYILLAFACFTTADDLKYKEWSAYRGTVYSVDNAPNDTGVILVKLELPELLGVFNPNITYKCMERLCGQIESNDYVYFDRKWNGSGDDWSMRNVEVVKGL